MLDDSVSQHQAVAQHLRHTRRIEGIESPRPRLFDDLRERDAVGVLVGPAMPLFQVELTGIEPTTSCLQSGSEPSAAVLRRTTAVALDGESS